MTAPVLGWYGDPSRSEMPASPLNSGTGTVSRYSVAFFGLASSDGDASNYTVRATYTPQAGGPAQTWDLPAGDYMGLFAGDVNGGEPFAPGVFEFQVISPEVSSNKLFMAITSAEDAYGAGAWYSDSNPPGSGGTPTEIGWGSLNFQGLPKEPPFLADNAGTAQSFFSSDYFYLGAVGNASGVTVDYTITYTPVSGGVEVTTGVGTGSTAEFGIQASAFRPGVTVITAKINNLSATNELVLTTTSSGGAYATVAWYGQPHEPVVGERWTNLVEAEER